MFATSGIRSLVPESISQQLEACSLENLSLLRYQLEAAIVNISEACQQGIKGGALLHALIKQEAFLAPAVLLA